MFVRLFVDENLDRNVPISRQPKEKIQAIVDSCTRQFPEHAPRARKRIQMYLKSCRKNKRTREQAGIDSTSVSTIFLLKHTWIEYSNVTTPKNILSRDLPFFPFQNRATPLQMNSVQCEQMLARACENESENAKRMRMGMEPVSQPMPASGPVSLSTSVVDSLSSIPNAVSTTTSFGSTTMMKQPKTEYKPEQLANLLQAAVASQPTSTAVTSSSMLSNSQLPSSSLSNAILAGATTTSSQPSLSSYPLISGMNGTATAAALYRQSLQQVNSGPAFPASIIQQNQTLQNGNGKTFRTSLGGLEPPTFRLTVERANRLRHRDLDGTVTIANKRL